MNKEAIQDRFLDAVKLLTEQTVAQLKYDRTIECVIVDATEKLDGIYTVEYEGTKFTAYARAGESYYENDVVLIQVPQNDFNKQKTILGRRDNEELSGKAYNFSYPFDNFIAFNQLQNQLNYTPRMGFQANNPAHGNSLCWTEDTPEKIDVLWSYRQTEDSKLFGTKLGLKVNVQTLLTSYNVREGEYGLCILVHGLKQEEDGEANPKNADAIFFTNNQMYGNPYGYFVPLEQQVVIDISKYLKIEGIDIAFWQRFTGDRINYVGSFKNIYNELIPYGATEEDEAVGAPVGDNILFSDLSVYMGVGVDEIKDSSLYLYTYDDLIYGHSNDGDIKILHTAWVDATNTATGPVLIDNEAELLAKDAHVYWYKHDSDWTPDNPQYDSQQPSHRFGGMFWKPIPEYQDKMSITEIIYPFNAKERYKTVVHYNGTYLTSPVLRFDNRIPVDAQAEDIARNDKYILKCATYGVDKNTGEKTLLADDALGNFFVYDENNNVLVNDSNTLYSDVIYYIEVYAKTYVEGSKDPVYVRLSDYTSDSGEPLPFVVEWQFPENATMIAQWNMIQRGEAYFSQRSDAQFERDLRATRSFRIAPTYNMRYANNDIVATIQRNGQTVTIRKTLQFGRAAALGCEYTPVISIVSPEGNYYIDTNSTYEIECLVYDRRGILIEENSRPECTFEWKFYGGRYKPAYYYPQNSKGFSGNVISGRHSVCEPFVVEVTVTGAADYPLTVRRGIMVGDNSIYMQEHDIQCPDRIEFRSDGQSPKYYHNTFSVSTLLPNGPNKYVYPVWNISNIKVLKLIESPVENQTYIAASGNSVTGGAHTEYALGFTTNKLISTTALDSKDYSQQWTDNLLSDEYFTYIYFTDGSATVAQAIAFDQNMYASSLVNEWNGQSLSLDEENSAVIAKMIAAGTKDPKNRFTGVMMGDWREHADDSFGETHDDGAVGLYGLSAGVQTFALKTDGTGFIGPSGKGRIHFDGRNALISNSDKTCYLNLNPVMVNKYLDANNEFTEENIWDLTDESGFSQYFLYCQVPRVKNTDTAWSVAEQDENGEYINTTWAKDFISPPEGHDNNNYDFFLVDPNNGVVTSGGIFARYGAIGKKYPWIISDSGLTQKNIFGTIFLGNPDKSPLSWPRAEDNIKFSIASGPWNKDQNDNPMFNSGSQATFGVTPDGYVYMRAGYIGLRNPWQITDDGLIAKIGNNAVYIGNPKKDENYHKINDMYQSFESAVTDGFMISAGKLSPLNEQGVVDQEQKSAAVFGVRPDGFMYSESGLIAGWSIEPNQLIKYADPKDKTYYLIKLDSENSQIAMVNNTVTKEPLILLDAVNKKVKIGTLEDEAEILLAGYQIIGDTKGSASVKVEAAISQATSAVSTDVEIPVYKTNAENGDLSETKVTKSVYLSSSDNGNIIINAITLSMATPNRFIINDKTNNRGFGIYTDGSATLITGTNTASNYLGTNNAPWNIFGATINTENLAATNNLVGKNVYAYDSFKSYEGAEETAGYFKVATRAYVNYRTREIADMIEALNQAVYDAFDWTKTRVNIMWSALGGKTDEIKANLAELKNAINSIGPAEGGETDGIINVTIPYTTIGGGGGQSITLNFNIAGSTYYKNALQLEQASSTQGTTINMLNKNFDVVTVDAPDVHKKWFDEGWKAAADVFSASVNGGTITIVGATPTSGETATLTYTITAAVTDASTTASVYNQTYTSNGSRTIYSYASATSKAVAYINGTAAATSIAKVVSDTGSATITVNVPTSSGSDDSGTT